jgi:tRNA(Phe) wybutosine-synthesizing methylase Tyw3
MKEKYFKNISREEDFDIVGMYFLEHNLLKKQEVDEDELLTYISSIIEAVTVSSCINDVNDEYLEQVKNKSREMIWLSIKSRFKLKSNSIL